jgi:hypothetical protein
MSGDPSGLAGDQRLEAHADELRLLADAREAGSRGNRLVINVESSSRTSKVFNTVCIRQVTLCDQNRNRDGSSFFCD